MDKLLSGLDNIQKEEIGWRYIKQKFVVKKLYSLLFEDSCDHIGLSDYEKKKIFVVDNAI